MLDEILIFIALYFLNAAMAIVIMIFTLSFGEDEVIFSDVVGTALVRPWCGVLFCGSFIAGYIKGRWGKIE